MKRIYFSIIISLIIYLIVAFCRLEFYNPFAIMKDYILSTDAGGRFVFLFSVFGYIATTQGLYSVAREIKEDFKKSKENKKLNI